MNENTAVVNKDGLYRYFSNYTPTVLVVVNQRVFKPSVFGF